MGCKISQEQRFIDHAAKEEAYILCETELPALNLSRHEITKFYCIFNGLDVDNDHLVSIAELLTFLEIERTSFSERVFRLFDQDGSMTIDFREFLLTVYNYCTLTNASLVNFAFDLYDGQSTGRLQMVDLKALASEINLRPESLFNHINYSIQTELKQDWQRDGIDIITFRRFVHGCQALLFPAFQLQAALQFKVMGLNFWQRAAKRRIELCGDKYTTLDVLLQQNISKTGLVQHLCKEVGKDVRMVLANFGNKNARKICSEYQAEESVAARIAARRHHTAQEHTVIHLESNTPYVRRVRKQESWSTSLRRSFKRRYDAAHRKSQSKRSYRRGGKMRPQNISSGNHAVP